MTGGNLLSDFVRQNIPSVWALELLLLLRRDASRCWAKADLVQELRASDTVVSGNLGKMAGSNLVLLDDQGCWRYAPAGAALDALCAELQAAYRERPVAVINMISKPSPVQSLADAFRLRGDGK